MTHKIMIMDRIRPLCLHIMDHVDNRTCELHSGEQELTTEAALSSMFHINTVVRFILTFTDWRSCEGNWKAVLWKLCYLCSTSRVTVTPLPLTHVPHHQHYTKHCCWEKKQAKQKTKHCVSMMRYTGHVRTENVVKINYLLVQTNAEDIHKEM